MNKKEDIEKLVTQIMDIEKNSMNKRFDAAIGNNEKFSATRADTEVVNSILSLLGEGKRV